MQQALEDSLISRTAPAQLCPMNLPKLPSNATYSELVIRAQKDSALYNQCARKHSALVEAIKNKEESVDLSPVGQRSL